MRHVLIAVVTVSACNVSFSQAPPKPLDLSKAKTVYSFPLNVGSAAFHFTVQLDGKSTITGVQVFRPDEAVPFQTLPACKLGDGLLKMELDEYDNERELLKHQDLNFDGFEDIELLQYYVPHLCKSIYCIYTWDPQNGKFRYAPEIPETDPVAHPENKTISVHEEFFGGVFVDRIYRLSYGKAQLVVENGKLYGSSRPDCGFTDYSSRLINGKMVTTVSRPSVCDHDEPAAVVCPATIPSISSPQRKR